MKRAFIRALGFGVLGGGLAVLASACGDVALPTTQASLLAPPGVPGAPHRTTSYVKVSLEAREDEREIAPGVTYSLWSFNGTVPGPLIRVHEGDTVEITLHNSGTSSVSHNIDLHSVNGPGGGAGATTVAPGETRAFTFKAMSAGLFTYHCAAGLVADHIANGMYGGILVEPSDGLPAVDHEFYIGQSDLYTTAPNGQAGKTDLSIEKLLAEQPTYVLFNGHTKSLLGDNALQAKAGETVRIYFVDGGPNLTSSFHVIGEIFDKAWAWGTLESLPVEGVQTISVPPGGSTIVQFKVDVPGDYKLVDHALGRVAKGAVGTLHVTGKNDDQVFGVPDGLVTAEMAGHDMTPPAAGAGSNVADGGTLKLTMKDNAFEPRGITTTVGAKVTFDLPNTGKVPHNLRIATLSGSFEGASSVSDPEIVNPAKAGTLSWTATEAGTYKFRCDVHPTEMTGTITVK